MANNFTLNAPKGAYADLSQLLPKYMPDYYKSLNPAYIKANTINGKLYGIPINANIYAQQTLAFNTAYLKKYNIDVSNVKTYADATAAFEKFHKANPSVATLAIGQGYVASGNYDYVLGNTMPFAVSTTDGSTKIVNPYDQKDMQSILETHHQWYQAGIIPAGAATFNQGYALNSNTWFAQVQTVGPFDYGNNALNLAASQDITIAPITKALITTGQAQMANYVISNTSKNKELAVKVMNEIDTDPQVLNTLVYGLEGQEWKFTGKTVDGTKQIELLPEYQKGTTHGAAWQTGNNAILYLPTTVSAAQVQARDASIKSATTSPLLGFNYDTTKMQAQITAIQNVMSQYINDLNTGTVDPTSTIKKMDAALKVAGYDQVLADMQKQYDAFLAQNK
jgi:putative aldouronate transport system substrate-binding protein